MWLQKMVKERWPDTLLHCDKEQDKDKASLTRSSIYRAEGGIGQCTYKNQKTRNGKNTYVMMLGNCEIEEPQKGDNKPITKPFRCPEVHHINKNVG